MKRYVTIPYITVACGVLLTLLSAAGLLEPGMANATVPPSALKAGIAVGLFNVVAGLSLLADLKPRKVDLSHER